MRAAAPLICLLTVDDCDRIGVAERVVEQFKDKFLLLKWHMKMECARARLASTRSTPVSE